MTTIAKITNPIDRRQRVAAGWANSGFVRHGAAHETGGAVRPVSGGAHAAPPTDLVDADCPVVRPGIETAGKEGLGIFAGVSAEWVGAGGLSFQIERVPPGARGKAHLHADHESAIYVLSGAYECRFGPGLSRRAAVRAGEFQFIPAGVPHLPVNLSQTEPVVALVARTDPNAQERVVLLPELDAAAD
jgi:uncharacterized RmlC-like cupin family protein